MTASMTEIYDDIELTCRSRYPIIYLLSWEEFKVLELLRKIAKKIHCVFVEWSLTNETDTDRGDALTFFESAEKTTVPTLFVLKDFHALLDRPRVIRRIRDMIPILQRSRSAFIILSPVLKIPEELLKDIYVIDIPLPDAASLRQVLNQVLAELKILFDEEFIEQIIYAIRGLTENEAYRVLHKTFMKGGGFKLQDIELLIEEKRKILKRTDLLDFSDEPIRLDDVGGLDRLKKWLVERQDGFSDTARSFGLPPPKGLLLLGVQGCGKSITAKAIASLWRIPLVRFDFSNLFRRDITPEDGLRRVIKLTESMAPIVLWIDELDKAFSNLRESQDSLTRVVGTFITWLQEKVSPVFIVATANTIEHLPPELLRKGRFDEVFFVDLPNVHEREKIFSIHIRKRGRDPVQFDLKLLAEKTEHFGGAEIEQVVVSSLFRAYHEKRDLVMADMLKSVENTIPLYETYEETIKALREWAHRRACLSSMDTSRVDLFE